jgi:hypothetical protein
MYWELEFGTTGLPVWFSAVVLGVKCVACHLHGYKYKCADAPSAAQEATEGLAA